MEAMDNVLESRTTDIGMIVEAVDLGDGTMFQVRISDGESSQDLALLMHNESGDCGCDYDGTEGSVCDVARHAAVAAVAVVVDGINFTTGDRVPA